MLGHRGCLSLHAKSTVQVEFLGVTVYNQSLVIFGFQVNSMIVKSALCCWVLTMLLGPMPCAQDNYEIQATAQIRLSPAAMVEFHTNSPCKARRMWSTE